MFTSLRDVAKAKPVYHVRVRVDHDPEVLHECIASFSNNYIVSQEVNKEDLGFHSHCWVQLMEDYSKADVMKTLKERIPNFKGNEAFSFKLAESKVNLARYCCKENELENIWYHGFSDQLMFKLKKTSYQKDFKKFKKLQGELEDEFYDGHIDFADFVRLTIDLRVEYGQTVKDHLLEDYMLKVKMRTDIVERHKYARHVWMKVRDKFNYDAINF